MQSFKVTHDHSNLKSTKTPHTHTRTSIVSTDTCQSLSCLQTCSIFMFKLVLPKRKCHIRGMHVYMRERCLCSRHHEQEDSYWGKGSREREHNNAMSHSALEECEKKKKREGGENTCAFHMKQQLYTICHMGLSDSSQGWAWQACGLKPPTS